MSGLAAVLSNTQATAYATAAALIPGLGFVFITGARVRKGSESWVAEFRVLVCALFVFMVAGEAATFASLLADRYWPLAHGLVIAGLAAAMLGVVIEGSINLGLVREPRGSSEPS